MDFLFIYMLTLIELLQLDLLKKTEAPGFVGLHEKTENTLISTLCKQSSLRTSWGSTRLPPQPEANNQPVWTLGSPSLSWSIP